MSPRAVSATLVLGGLAAAALALALWRDPGEPAPVAPPPTPGGTVRVLDELPGTLHPLFARTAAERRAVSLAYETLFTAQVDGAVDGPLLAGSALSADGRTLRGALRADARWADGAAITSADVCATLAAILAPGAGSPLRPALAEVALGCSAEGERDFAIHLARPLADARAHLAIPILPAAALPAAAAPDADLARASHGTGPLRAELGRHGVRYLPAEGGARRAAFAGVQQQELTDPLVAARTLTLGAVDLVVRVPAPLHDELVAAGARLSTWETGQRWGVAFDTTEGALARPELRRGVEACLDRDALQRLVLRGRHTPAGVAAGLISGPFSPVSPLADPSLPPRAGADPAAMEAHLLAGGAARRAGVWHLGEAPIHLDLGVHAELERADSLLRELGAQLRACGFDVSDWLVDATQWAGLAGTPAAAASFDLLVAAWTPGPTEDWRALAAEAPFGHADPALAAAVDALHRAATPDEAARAGAALHRHLAAQVPYAFLWDHRAVAAWGPRVSGAPDHAASPFDHVEQWRVAPDPPEPGRADAADRE